MFGDFERWLDTTLQQSELDRLSDKRDAYRLCTVYAVRNRWTWSNNPGKPVPFDRLPDLIQNKIAVLELLPPQRAVSGLGWWQEKHYFLYMSEEESLWDKPKPK